MKKLTLLFTVSFFALISIGKWNESFADERVTGTWANAFVNYDEVESNFDDDVDLTNIQLTVSPSGRVRTVEYPDFKGAMSRTHSEIFYVAEPGYELGVLVLPGEDYVLSDLDSNWDVYLFESNNFTSAAAFVPIVIDDGEVTIYGVYNGTVAIDQNGIMTDTEDNIGILTKAKNLFILVNARDESITEPEIIIGVKQGATCSPSDLEGKWWNIAIDQEYLESADTNFGEVSIRSNGDVYVDGTFDGTASIADDCRLFINDSDDAMGTMSSDKNVLVWVNTEDEENQFGILVRQLDGGKKSNSGCVLGPSSVFGLEWLLIFSFLYFCRRRR
jgi:hypothetical protein